VWVAADSTIKFSFQGIGSDHPKSSDSFLLDEGHFVFVWYLQGRIIEESDRTSH
jgi:hypothetical protein